MNPLNKYHAIVYSVLVFAGSLFFGLYIEKFSFLLSGTMVVVFLSLFYGRFKTTIFVSVVCLATLLFYQYHISPTRKSLIDFWDEVYFSIVFIFYTALLLYTKDIFKRLSEDKTHKNSLFENATEGIIVANQRGRIILSNPAAERLFGYDKSELIDQPIELLVPEKLSSNHQNLREKFLVGQTMNRAMADGRELIGRKKNGDEFPVEISLSTYKQYSEKFVIAFIVDIEKRKKIEENMQRQKMELEKLTAEMKILNQELEAKVEERTNVLSEALQKLETSQQELSEALEKEKQLNEIKSRFLSMASHEFRTPLSTIFSSAMLTAKYISGDDQEKRERHINKIKDSVYHLNELLEDFLSLGKLEMKKDKIKVKEFKIDELVADLEDELRVLLKTGQQLISTTRGENIFSTDNRILKNALINLLSNAIKFSGNYKRIDLNIDNRGDMLFIFVRDQGVGIPEEDRKNLFTTFFRAKNVTNIEGTGLGLQIVKRYVEQLEGTIHYESQINLGTTFYLEIPLKK